MCGITGVFAFTDAGRNSLSALQASTDAIVSRGPDSQGHFVFDQCGLGFRRLAILDLSADGNQPMTDESGRYTIVFNGEIFNFSELRQKLVAKGHRFHSQTDTEVILHLYISRGAQLSSRSSTASSASPFTIRRKTPCSFARDRYGVEAPARVPRRRQAAVRLRDEVAAGPGRARASSTTWP